MGLLLGLASNRGGQCQIELPARIQETLTALMEDVISHMAGYVPLKAIAERILAAYARDPFGDFKVCPDIPLSTATFKTPSQHLGQYTCLYVLWIQHADAMMQVGMSRWLSGHMQ